MKMMITGASRGIGASCKKKFEDGYNVISIARTGEMTENGDLASLDFRNMIIDKYRDIDVLINNAGVLDDDAFAIYELNQIAACHLMEVYAERGTQIINMGSEAANWSPMSSISDKHLHYSISKGALKRFAQFVSVKYDCKITTLEPGRVGGTGMTKDSKLKPEHIAEIIEWILEQPFVVESMQVKGD